MKILQILNFEIIKTYSINSLFGDSITLASIMELLNLIDGDNGVFENSVKNDADPVIRIATWLFFLSIVIIRIGVQLSKWKSYRLDNQKKEQEIKKNTSLNN